MKELLAMLSRVRGNLHWTDVDYFMIRMDSCGVLVRFRTLRRIRLQTFRYSARKGPHAPLVRFRKPPWYAIGLPEKDAQQGNVRGCQCLV